MSYTVVSFHAHPDDEALLTAGTLARAAAEGHRTVLVVATDGAAGLTAAATLASGETLASIRSRELAAAASTLGIQDVVDLGYGDSGDSPESQRAAAAADGRQVFATADLDEAARRLADVLRRENADVLTTYDSAGGYGHPDHVRVHAVGARAAELAGTPLVLEATVDRAQLRRALRMVNWLPGLPAGFRVDVSEHYCASDRLTHRIDVRPYLDLKRTAMAAHASQTTADADTRTLEFCLRLPRWLYARVFAYEWFREVGRAPHRPLLDDLFASLR